MHVFDIIVLCAFCVFAVMGLVRGFIAEAFRLAALAGGFVGAILFYDSLYAKLGFLKTPASAKTVIAFVVCYLAIALVLTAIGWLVKKAVHLAMLGWIDRLLGGVVGAGKAALVVWVFVLSISLLPHGGLRSVFTDSRAYGLFSNLPVKLHIPRLGSRGDRGVGLPGVDTPKAFKQAHEKISTLKQKVDSLKELSNSQ